MQREKLMRKKSGYQRPSSVSAFCSEMQPTGRHGAQVARYATLFAVGVAGQDDAPR
jgi:hypothetical protein